MTDLVTTSGSMEVGAAEWNALVREQIAPKITDAELLYLAEWCRATGLNAVIHQVHVVHRYNNRDKKDVMSLQVGVDGFRAVADRTGVYAGSDDAVFEGATSDGYPEIARVTVYKLLGGTRVAFTASARWAEFYPGDRMGTMWRKMPHVMLAKCAECAALRKGFPQQLAQVYEHAEMQQADAEQVTEDDREALIALAIQAGIVEAAARAASKKVRTVDQYERSVKKLQTQIDERNSLVEDAARATEIIDADELEAHAAEMEAGNGPE